MSPKLEELILSGQAEYRNQSCFASQAFSIPCPAGKQIVITDLEFSSGLGFLTIVPTGFLIMKFYGINQGRENIISFYTNNDTGNFSNSVTWRKDVYFCYNSPVRIDIACLLNEGLPAVDVSVMPSVSKDKPVPGGYGTTIAVTRAIDLTGAGDFYLPQGLELSGFPITGNMRNDPWPDVTAGLSALPSPGAVSHAFNLNVGYVLLNKPIIPKL